MLAEAAHRVYTLAPSPAEREALLVSLELGVAPGTGAPPAACMGLLAELDAAPLDRLADVPGGAADAASTSGGCPGGRADPSRGGDGAAYWSASRAGRCSGSRCSRSSSRCTSPARA